MSLDNRTSFLQVENEIQNIFSDVSFANMVIFTWKCKVHIIEDLMFLDKKLKISRLV